MANPPVYSRFFFFLAALVFRVSSVALIVTGIAVHSRAATDSAFAVQASATVQASPAQITLSWTPGPSSANGYVVSRKDVGATTWTPLINLVGSATSYTDTNVSVGRAYEYQIIRQAPGITGYGYVAAGIDLPVVDQRGRVILVVDRSIADALSGELAQFTRDLVGDGWTVARRDVSRADSPALVRNAIRDAYNQDRSATRAVLLIGHVPVARSGNANIDGHGGRPLPADSYYGDIDGTWQDANGDGVFDHDQLPSDVELMVGRIDFADLPGRGARTPFPSETELLRQYFRKNHEYRHAQRRVTFRALVADRIGDANGEAFGGGGWRNFSALLGSNRITTANVEDNSPLAERWITRLTAQDWLWVFGAGGGDVTLISGLGSHGPYSDVWSVDLVESRARGMFYLFFGSWSVEWDRPDNLLRAALAAPDYGLTAVWAGRPPLFLHPVALGEPIGYGIRLSQNNASVYSTQTSRGTRGVHLALMGDPTLRQQVVAPPSGLVASGGGGSPTLNWSASADATEGYHVYRSSSDEGPFSRLTTTPLAATSYTDTTAPAGTLTYLVRAVRRDTSGSATYSNLSQGTSVSATVTTSSAPPSPPVTSPVGNSGGSAAPGGGSAASGGGGGGAASGWFVLVLAILIAARWASASKSIVGETP